MYKLVERHYHSLAPSLRERVNRLTIAVETLRTGAEVGLNVADDIAVVGGDEIMIVGLLSPALTTFRSAANTKYAIRSTNWKLGKVYVMDQLLLQKRWGKVT